MKLIGAGFPRTGTMSTQAALEQLGLGPCYHFSTLMERPQDIEVWQMIVEGKSPDWETLFTGFHSTVDWPGGIFYKELMEQYPDAKVLLNIRDANAWYESMRNTIYMTREVSLSAPEGSIQARTGHFVDTSTWQNFFHGRFEDKSYAISVFEQRNQEVKDFVPAGRLLVWSVKEGWEPLCRFLDVEVPKTPFPHVNDTESFRQRFAAQS